MDFEKLDTKCYWFPTRESGQKYIDIKFECIMNTENEKLNNKTLFETLSVESSMSCLPSSVQSAVQTTLFKNYIKKVYARGYHNEANNQSVFTKTGGVLNLFNPNIKEKMDKDFMELIKIRENRAEAVSSWISAKSDLWNDLTPGLVWVGTGESEGRLLTDFLEKFTDKMNGNAFYSQGDAILKSIKLLRTWQFASNELCNGRRPYDVIVEERRMNYRRKIGSLESIGISTDFK